MNDTFFTAHPCGCATYGSIAWPECAQGRAIKEAAYGDPSDANAWRELQQHFYQDELAS